MNAWLVIIRVVDDSALLRLDGARCNRFVLDDLGLLRSRANCVARDLLGKQADRTRGRLVRIDFWFLPPFLGCGIDQSKAAGVDKGAILAGEHLAFKGEDTRSLPSRDSVSKFFVRVHPAVDRGATHSHRAGGRGKRKPGAHERNHLVAGFRCVVCRPASVFTISTPRPASP